MNNSEIDKEHPIRMKCPECLNYMKCYKHSNGGISGKCPVCKVSIFSKQHSPKQKIIRIIKN